jgi:hypothetical protein
MTMLRAFSINNKFQMLKYFFVKVFKCAQNVDLNYLMIFYVFFENKFLFVILTWHVTELSIWYTVCLQAFSFK